MISSSYIESACQIISNSKITCISSAQIMSGSIFLYSLLDSHPDLHTNPHCISEIIPTKDISKQFNFPEQLKVLLNHDHFFDTSKKSSTNTGLGLHDLGEKKNSFLKVDKEKFEEFLLAVFSQSEINIKNFILAVILAYEYLISGKIKSTNHFAVYTHDPITSHQFLEVLDKPKIIFIFRNQVNTYNSLYNHYIKKSFQIGRIQSYKKFSYNYLFRSLDFLLSNFHEIPLISLEELHYNPKKSLLLLCNNIGIEFNDSLLKSTINNLEWWGLTNTKINGFSKSLHAYVANKEIGLIDELDIEILAGKFHEILGYPSLKRISLMEKIISTLPGKSFIKFYYYNFIFLNNHRSIKKRNLYFAINILIFPFYRLKCLFQNYYLMVKINNKLKHSSNNFVVINPISANAQKRRL